VKIGIVAGGVGSRLPDETFVRPKPMIEIGGHPILWHIMSHYGHYGFNEFVVAVGYKGEQIKAYLADYHVTANDVRIHVGAGEVEIYGRSRGVDWVVDVVDTGRWTESGGRVKRMARYLGDQTFMVTFGDVVSDVDIDALLALHKDGGKLATVTAVRPPPRFGELTLSGSEVVDFSEKPRGSGWIIGGYMVMEPDVMGYIDGDHVPLAPEPIRRLQEDGQLTVHRHEGFWHGVDTLRDRKLLEQLWEDGSPPWRIWG
jgi:glucose-1-phosphate cytidylyltransferase